MDSFQSIRNIQEIILEKTPDFIKEPLITLFSEIKIWREDMLTRAESSENWEFLSIFFEYRIVFYGILLLLTYVIIRLIIKIIKRIIYDS